MATYDGSTPFESLTNELEDMMFTNGKLISNPPTGGLKITNLFIKDGKLQVEYDDGA